MIKVYWEISQGTFMFVLLLNISVPNPLLRQAADQCRGKVHWNDRFGIPN